MRTQTLLLIAAVLVAAATSLPAQPQNGEPGDVWVGGYYLLTIRTPAAGFSVAQRAAQLQGRINDLLRGQKTSLAVTVIRSGSNASVYAGGRLLATATPADARASRTTPYKLATLWARRLAVVFPKATPDKPGVGRPRQ